MGVIDKWEASGNSEQYDGKEEWARSKDNYEAI